MSTEQLIDELLDTWRINDGITQAVLRAVPAKGLLAIPLASKGRNVAEQFRHLQRVRAGWLQKNRHPGAKQLEFFRKHKKGEAPDRAELLAAFKASGKAVESYLRERLSSGKRIQFFAGRATRWLAYMIAHEAHHRGQILLALKQAGTRLPDSVALTDVWFSWYRTKVK